MFKFPKDLIIIDFETSGTDNKTASIIQFGAVIFNKEGFLENRSFDKYVHPYTQEWSESAYQVHGLTRSFLKSEGECLEDVIVKFEQWASRSGLYDLQKKYWIAQWACGFDVGFLQEAYKIVGKPYPFHYRAFDIASIVRFELAKKGKLTKKCGTNKCAEVLGIKVDTTKLHDAKYDAMLAGQLLEYFAQGGTVDER